MGTTHIVLARMNLGESREKRSAQKLLNPNNSSTLIRMAAERISIQKQGPEDGNSVISGFSIQTNHHSKYEEP